VALADSHLHDANWSVARRLKDSTQINPGVAAPQSACAYDALVFIAEGSAAKPLADEKSAPR
jgi:hypothetical protein